MSQQTQIRTINCQSFYKWYIGFVFDA